MACSDPTSGNFAYVRDTKYLDDYLLRLIKHIVNVRNIIETFQLLLQSVE